MRRALAGLACVLLAAGLANTRQAEELPLPNLDPFEPSVREQLKQLHAEATTGNESAKYGALGETYLAYELPRDAELALVVAAQLDPEEPKWPYYRAMAALEVGDPESAADHFDRTLELAPDHLQTLLRSASNLLGLGRLSVAEVRYQSADAAIGDAQLPGMKAALHFGRGRLAAERGRHQEAVAEFRRALEFQPAADGIYYHLATSLHRLGDREAARQAMAKRGDTQPTFVDPWFAAMKRRAVGGQADVLRGLRALKEGRLDDAEDALRRALDSSPDNIEALTGLARVHQLRGQTALAEALYRRAIETDPNAVEALLNLGALLASRGEASGAEALDLFRRAAQADPRSAAAHHNLGLELLRQGRSADGEQALRRSLELQPGDPAALEALARSQASRRDFAAAAATYRALVAAAPDRAEVHFGLALVLTLGERCAEARPVLEYAVERFAQGPASALLTGLLARVLATCPDDAARNGERAVELARPLFQEAPSVETGRTLAMALAEAGRMIEAAEQIRRLMAAAQRAGATQALPVLQQELEQYEQGQAIRSPWAG